MEIVVISSKGTSSHLMIQQASYYTVMLVSEVAYLSVISHKRGNVRAHVTGARFYPAIKDMLQVLHLCLLPLPQGNLLANPERKDLVFCGKRIRIVLEDCLHQVTGVS